MSLGNLLGRLFSGPDDGHPVEELAARLGVHAEDLRAIRPTYREFTIPKRSGGARVIAAPDDELKAVQRLILRRVLTDWHVHGAATGFRRGHSIVTNALLHAGKAVVVRMDLRDFFPSTDARRVNQYFQRAGWNREASGLLERLCTHKGGLPQGAPTSPRLSNLVNYRLDARLAGLAGRFGATYTRYADDLTFSFSADDAESIHAVIGMTKHIVGDEGYRLHGRRKLHIRRWHDRQLVTGLVVNAGVALPRETRRWLRAVEHRLATGKPITLSEAELAGWRSLCAMIEKQRSAGKRSEAGSP